MYSFICLTFFHRPTYTKYNIFQHDYQWLLDLMLVHNGTQIREEISKIVNYLAGDEKPYDIWSWHYSIQEQGTKVLSLEIYKYQIYTSGGGWQVKKGQAQLCNNKQQRKKEICDILSGKPTFAQDNLITLFYWIDVQCGIRNLPWFIHCHSLPDSLW